jgi:CoA:oxalate CoA-transferase
MTALDNITVVDFTRILSGPYCTMVLSDLGARVIKIERAGAGDDSRQFPPVVEGTSSYFASVNRGKESIALDLTDAEDLAVARSIVAEADVLVENFRPGVMDRLGLGYRDASRLNPNLIYTSISGFGQDGPYRDRPAYDMVVQAMGGIMSITGHPDTPPTRVGTSVGDIFAGLFAVARINAALVARSQGGTGEHLDISMLDCQTAILESAIGRFFATGESPGPMGSRHPSITPFAAYRASDGYLVIAAGNGDLFSRLCDALGRPDLALDPRFATNESRGEAHEELSREIEEALAARSVIEWLDSLGERGIPCGPINNIQQALTDPQTTARGMVITARDAAGTEFKMAGSPLVSLKAQHIPGLDEHGDALRAEFAHPEKDLET